MRLPVATSARHPASTFKRAELEMDADYVRPKLLHFFEVLDDGRPFLVPIVLNQPTAAFLVIVVEAPRCELLPRFFEDK